MLWFCVFSLLMVPTMALALKSTMMTMPQVLHSPLGGRTLSPLQVGCSSIQSLEETWNELEVSGLQLVGLRKHSLFFRAIAAGAFVGFGGLLSASVGFDMGKAPWESGMGFARMISGLVGFPLSIILMTMTGNGAWTGDALSIAIGVFKGKIIPIKAVKMLSISYMGCLVGVTLVAALANGAAVPACAAIAPIVSNRMTLNPLKIFCRGVGGGCLIFLGIFLSKCARDMTGKVLGILFPISTYVIIGFDHYLASLFFFCTAGMGGLQDPSFTLRRAILYTFYATIGNFIGGALMVGCGLSSIPKNELQFSLIKPKTE